jgi:hypothetical protein
VVDVLDCFPEKLLYANGETPSAGGSGEIVVVDSLQEIDQRGHERKRTREGKRKCKKLAVLAHGFDDGDAKKARLEVGGGTDKGAHQSGKKRE